jgi:hypothetical protein
MSVPDDHSYFSRFLLKFVEIIAAGLATAASGYLIAHLSGALSSPAPAPAAAVIQVIPSTSTVSGSLPAQPIPPPISANINEQRLSPQEVNAPRVAQPARKTVNTTKAEPPRKHSDSATNATESTRDRESFVARVQAALANANANRTDALMLSPPHANGTLGPAIVQPAPTTDPSRGAVVTTAPVQELTPNPVTAVDVNSSPAASVQSLPAPATAKETGMLSTLGQILRHDPLAGADEAPRPPMPVGQ